MGALRLVALSCLQMNGCYDPTVSEAFAKVLPENTYRNYPINILV
jgi:hypothetical protein